MPASGSLLCTKPADSVMRLEVGLMHHQASGTCEWVGPRRVEFRGIAPVVGLLHAAENGCVPAAPLRPSTVLRPRAVRQFDAPSTSVIGMHSRNIALSRGRI
jgi:hypothetical protein